MLIVAEKYRMAHVLAKVLKFEKFSWPFFYNEAGDVIAYSQGHLFQPKHLKDDLYTWSDPKPFESLPTELFMLPTVDYTIRVRKRSLSTGYLREHVPMLMQEHDVIVNACDPDKEGERIFYDLFNSAQTSAVVLRLDLSKGITQSLIHAAYDNLFDARKTKAKHYSAQARLCGDLGYALLTSVMTFYGRKGCLHPLLAGYTDKQKSVVSVGRVLIPVLQLIDDQCCLVENVKLKQVHCPYVEGRTESGAKVTFYYDWQRLGLPASALSDPRLAQKYIQQKSLNDEFVIESVINEMHVVSAPDMYDTASMQADMKELSPTETLDVLQSLYEKGLITYPRTDETALPDDDMTSDKLSALFASMDNNLNSVSDRTSKSSRGFLEKHESLIENALPDNSNNQSNDISAAHTALSPTSAQANLSNLTDTEIAVYSKICERFTSALEGEKSVCITTVTGKFTNDKNGMLGEQDAPFSFEKSTYTSNLEKSKSKYIALNEGDIILLDKINVRAEALDIPQYYAENEIPLVMLKVGDQVSDPVVAKLLHETKGLGSASTRDKIVASLLKRDYVEISIIDERRCIIITGKGKAILSTLPNQFKSPVTTAIWEHEFYKIETCNDLELAKQMRDGFIRKIYTQLETYIKFLNKRYGRNVQGVSSGNDTLPSKELIFKVKQLARLKQLELPIQVLNSNSLAEKWLLTNASVMHSSMKEQLEQSGLSTCNNALRDERRIDIRKQAIQGKSSNPPTQAQMLKAIKLSKQSGVRMPEKAKKTASECHVFIDECKKKLTPSDEQINTLKRLAAKHRYPVSKLIYKSRKQTLNLINKLRTK
ncbi:DNA topoisomerase [Aliivibrio finisterrensis]|uniref:DNA topoisomerase n=1 Tax=Aliivibrio finisterrensis TaxID=511998 RepID=A0ABY0I5Q4_9GAMM|nr:DNA topoisomerase [Aliivibrio finisterrensis]RYU63795.1 DNA topoisomerase [Aliivibrio finisterrensis]RYU82731.1 DNA topoisomerase [Aliivibrio finisterrensis]